MSDWWWYSTPKMTFLVNVEKGVVRAAPQILRRFIGQEQTDIEGWFAENGGFSRERIVRD